VGSDTARTLHSINFGEDFEFDFRAYRLRRSGRVLKQERIPMEVLAVLLEQKGQLVSREHLVERIWGKGTFLDTDNSINGAIRKVRQVLKDDPEQPRFIQTVMGKGYRFIAPVTYSYVQTPVSPTLEVAPELPPAGPVTDNRVLGRGPALLGIATILIVATLGYLQWSRYRVRPVARNGKVMLAVLPFENLTGDASQDYFSDGMTEEMIAQLGNSDPQRLGVIARTSVMQYKHNIKGLDQIGRELGVEYTMEGSVRRDSGKVRITTQLIQVKDQTHLWSAQYDRDSSDLLALQSEIAQKVVSEIEPRIGVHERASTHPSFLSKESEAYELYLRGRYFWNKRTSEGLQQAIDYFQQAVSKDPGYSRAYAGLAEAYALTGAYSSAPPVEVMPKARAAALRAVQLDEALPEAHTALAVIAQDYDWDWLTAGKEYRRAIQLNPNYATGHQWYAECLALQGRFDEAFPEIETARQLDPLSLIIAADYGAIFYFSRQYDQAIEHFHTVLDMEPNFPRAKMLVWAYAQKGRLAEALAEAENSRIDGPWKWAMIAYISGRLGDQSKVKLALDQLQNLRKQGTPDPMSFAVAYIGKGNRNQALAWLEKAYLARSGGLTALKVDPTYDPLRADPRFQVLIHRIGLAR